MGNVDVVAAVIEKNKHVLICQRAVGKRHGGLWEFPGGKVQAGEDHPTALKRELYEELRLLHLEIVKELFVEFHADGEYVIHFYKVNAREAPKLIEHQSLKWVEFEELENYRYAPADDVFVKSHLEFVL